MVTASASASGSNTTISASNNNRGGQRLPTPIMESKMSQRVTIADAAKLLYASTHDILKTAEAGMPISEDQMRRAQNAMDTADRVHALRSTVYDEDK